MEGWDEDIRYKWKFIEEFGNWKYQIKYILGLKILVDVKG